MYNDYSHKPISHTTRLAVHPSFVDLGCGLLPYLITKDRSGALPINLLILKDLFWLASLVERSYMA